MIDTNAMAAKAVADADALLAPVDDDEQAVARYWEQIFAELVRRMKSGEAEVIPDEPEWIRQGKLTGAESILQDLRDELAAHST